MKEQEINSKQEKAIKSNEFDYNNSGWPRDFDIRIEVAKQREVLDCS